MLCKCHWIVLYILCILQHFVWGGGVFSGHGVLAENCLNMILVTSVQCLGRHCTRNCDARS